MSFIEKIFENQFHESLAIISILAGCILLLLYIIPKTPFLKQFTAIPFLFFGPMLLSNLGIIPISHELYKPLQNIVLFMAIFFMVGAIDIKVIMKTIKPRIFILFLIGCFGVVAGSFCAFFIFKLLIPPDHAAKLAGAVVGGYTGGSMNWASVAMAVEMPASLNSAGFPAVVIVYTIFLGFIIYMAKSPLRKKLEKWVDADYSVDDFYEESKESNEISQENKLNYKHFIIGLFCFSLTYLLSDYFCLLLKPYIFVPTVILITTAALAFGNLANFSKVKGTPELGEASLYFLLAIIGAKGNVLDTFSNAPILLLFPIIVIFIHLIILLLGAKLIKVDFVSTCVVSVAAIGGAASAPIIAAVYKKDTLIPLGILLGSAGYVVGNYLGIYLVTFLQLFT